MKRRMLMGLLLDGKTGRAFHAPIEPNADELEIITRRQSISVVSRCADGAPLEMDETLQPKRDWRYVVAATCGVVVAAAFVAALILAVRQ